MKIHAGKTALAMALSAGMVLSFFGDAFARADRCKVTDPTGTPLNVRARPGGPIINRLRNGRMVEILETARDRRGRPWAYVGGYYRGNWREWGWVFREFISCY